MVNENNVTKIVSPQAGHLAPLQGWFLFNTVLTSFDNFFCSDHVLLPADASLMFGVEIELETCRDNV